MARRERPKACKHCGRRGTARAPISWRGSCARCSEERMRSTAISLTARSGLAYERWQAAMVRVGERERARGVVDTPTEAASS